MGEELVQVTIKRVLDKSGPSPRIATTIETTKRLGPVEAAQDKGGWVANMEDDGAWGEEAVAPAGPPNGSGGGGGPVKAFWSSVGGQAFQAVQTKGRLGKVCAALTRSIFVVVFARKHMTTQWSCVGSFVPLLPQIIPMQNKGWLQSALVLSATATAVLLVVLAVLGIIGMLGPLEAPLQAALLLSVVVTIVLARICSS